ncbi:MAG: ThiF family adenylyltransferase [Anaerolineae bacterium]|jgi:molybdopterin/thiamine biosynthesis adenylyltransferase|nr:ThiF family adenylyltransferase [Anaerolineae bacterium]
MSWDRVERLFGSENLARLGRSRVVIAGLGSGGGFVALTLAMSGVGNFILVDNDTLEESNFVRHVADRRYLGWNKAAAVADLIKHRNPNAQIQVIEDKIESHLHLLDGVDLLIVGVDNENTKYILNEACVERDLTAIYAGVYERGEGGDVVRIDPGNGPCYACWAAELREGLFQPTASQNLDYGMINQQGTLDAEPGLYLHVAKVAAIQSDFALTELLKGVRPPYPANTIIIANAAMEIVDGEQSPPHSSLWVDVPRDPYCLVCGELINRDEFDETQKFSLSDLAGTAGLTIESNQP